LIDLNEAGPRIAPFIGGEGRTVALNSRVQLSCVIEEGDAPFTIRWSRDSRPVVPSQLLKVTDFNAYSSILTVHQLSLAHAGNYSCRAENDAGSASQSTFIRVTGQSIICMHFQCYPLPTCFNIYL